MNDMSRSTYIKIPRPDFDVSMNHYFMNNTLSKAKETRGGLKLNDFSFVNLINCLGKEASVTTHLNHTCYPGSTPSGPSRGTSPDSLEISDA